MPLSLFRKQVFLPKTMPRGAHSLLGPNRLVAVGLCWMQSAVSIVYVYLRLEQREQTQGQERNGMWKMGQRATLYTSFNLASSLSLSLLAVLPSFIFIPFLLQWLEAIRIGMRQLVVSTLWTVLFIFTWTSR